MAARSKRRSKSKPQKRQWRRMDLHLHTPGSNDYQEPHLSYLDILHQAEIRGLDIIAFTDHNTVAGFAAMKMNRLYLPLLVQGQQQEFDSFLRNIILEYNLEGKLSV